MSLNSCISSSPIPPLAPNLLARFANPPIIGGSLVIKYCGSKKASGALSASSNSFAIFTK